MLLMGYFPVNSSENILNYVHNKTNLIIFKKKHVKILRENKTNIYLVKIV